MGTPFRTALSRTVGWLADCKIPRPLRAIVYRGYARATGADLSQMRLPLEEHPCLGAFFARRLKEGARTIERDPALFVSPVDGTLQSLSPLEQGTILQAKGKPYSVRELLGGEEDPALEGGFSWTIYLSPRDYHRIHAHESCRLTRAHWLAGSLYSVAPAVLARRMVLPVNERVALRLETARGAFWLVLVGATNVGRMRVVGLETGREGELAPALPFERGAELARFEMGSTIVLLAPRGLTAPLESLREGDQVKLGQAIGRYLIA
ncbi:MAG: phosphatidylserine decarboxylase [Planctomycetes bacterium]|nr:phosphatidylserine decarboxylase [Planctomycetota bacterium]